MSNALILGPLQRSGTALPLFDARVPAGFPSPALDHMEHKLSLDALLDLQAPHTYVVAVSGDSMIGAGIHDGDLALVRMQTHANDGDIVVAMIEDEATIRRFFRQQNRFRLQPENPEYQPLVVSAVDILGKVVWVFRRIQ